MQHPLSDIKITLNVGGSDKLAEEVCARSRVQLRRQRERKDQNVTDKNREKLEMHFSRTLTFRKQLLIIQRKAAHLYGLAKFV